jgi:hypothetical protein
MKQKNNRQTIFSLFIPSLIFILILVIIIIFSQKINILEEKKSISPITNRYVLHSYSINISNSQIVYVPVYSHLNSSERSPQLLETTLSIRNSDPVHSINILSTRYFDTEGNKLQDYLQSPLTLKPLQSTEFLIDKKDNRGGSGANFIVEWASDIPVYEPIIEAIMIGSKGSGISFKSTGRPLSKRSKK